MSLICQSRQLIINGVLHRVAELHSNHVTKAYGRPKVNIGQSFQSQNINSLQTTSPVAYGATCCR